MTTNLEAYNHTTVLPHGSGGEKAWAGFPGLKQGCVPSAGSSGEAISLPFPAFRGHLHFFTCGLFLQFQSQPSLNPDVCFNCHITFLDVHLPFPSFKNPSDSIGPIQIIQENLPLL